ncbi:MAG: DegT/DnrJ/EryC1/StrS family aminotransferase [Gemmataceae bacterium]
MAGTRNVPLCDVQAQYEMLESQIRATVEEVLASGRVILGPNVQALEEEIARYCRAGYGVGCASGTDALSLALHALGVGAGDEVILPTFTFFATAGSVCRTGAKPVFVDIDPLTYNLDPQDVERKITKQTRAIIAVHLYGQAADMEPLWRLAEEHHIGIIEDAAQAIGAEYQNKRAGTLGALACYSFYPSKNLGCCGDGGMVVTSDPEWAQYMKALRIHGMEPKYHHKYLGWNSRLDEIQAAIVRVKLPHLETWTEGRRVAAHRYNNLIDEYGVNGYLTKPVVSEQCRHVYNQYVVRVADGQRDALVKHLKANQIGCEIYYPIPLHLQQCLAYLGYREGDFPVSEEASHEVLAMPMFPDLSEEQQRYVLEKCVEFFGIGKRVAA